MDEKKFQEKFLQFQVDKQELNAYLQERELIEQKIEEIRNTLVAIEKLKQIKEGEKFWSPLGAGVFVEGDLRNTKNLPMAIGAGVVVKRDSDSVSSILKNKMEELTNLNNELIKEIERLAKEMEKLEPEIQQFLKEKES